jgi:squalene monooxygenase
LDHGGPDCLEGIDAQRVLGYALFKGGKDAKVGYPLEGYGEDIAGRSFHNGRFVQKLREKAGSLPSYVIHPHPSAFSFSFFVSFVSSTLCLWTVLKQ